MPIAGTRLLLEDTNVGGNEVATTAVLGGMEDTAGFMLFGLLKQTGISPELSLRLVALFGLTGES